MTWNNSCHSVIAGDTDIFNKDILACEKGSCCPM